jgi:hypothetical protein
LGPGLPDFSWYNIKKWENIPNNNKVGIPNSHKIYQNGGKIDQHLLLQDPTKFTQNGIFLFENMPSGNPDWVAHTLKHFLNLGQTS